MVIFSLQADSSVVKWQFSGMKALQAVHKKPLLSLFVFLRSPASLDRRNQAVYNGEESFADRGDSAWSQLC